MDKCKLISKYNSNYIKKVMDKGHINDFDIINIMSLDYVEFLNFFDSERIKTNRALYLIYLNPTLLYKCDNLSEEVASALIDFVIYRFSIEKQEIQYRYEDGQISKEERDCNILTLENHYFDSDDIVGKNIKRIMEKNSNVLLKK